MSLSCKLGGFLHTCDTNLVIESQRQVVETSKPSRELGYVATDLTRREADNLLEYRKHLCNLSMILP
jgi:hypothetical protein